VAVFTIEFAKKDQSLGALREAAYRLIGEASCQIGSTDHAYVCRIEPASQNKRSEADLRARFLDLVTDENLRDKLATETGRARDLIMALAFGALANEASEDSVPPSAP
jgi:His-Xaa-Ser system protein HxsD